MLPKNRIRLSRYLHAQTTPYPEAKRWLKRLGIFLIIIFATGIYLFAVKQESPTLQEAPKQILGEQQQIPSPEYLIYIVKKGDTLFNLSQRYQVSWQTLAELNNLQEPYILKIGQEIKIPAELKESKPRISPP